MSDRLTIALNLARKAPSQYLNLPFESVVSFNGQAVFFGPTGIFAETGDDDAGTPIDAYVDLPLHDFKAREQKSIEAFDVGYEANGSLELTLTGDEVAANARSFVLAPQQRSGQRDGMRTLKKYRYGLARYWQVRIANRDGCDFSLDSVALAPVVLKRRNF